MKLTEEELEEGVSCPTCGQHAQIYHRPIYGSMAAALLKMYSSGDEWMHVGRETQYRGGDVLKLRYWNLIESQTSVDLVHGKSGLWRVTALGRAFSKRRARVQKYARIYNGSLLGLHGEWVTIDDCLGKKFDYYELVG